MTLQKDERRLKTIKNAFSDFRRLTNKATLMIVTNVKRKQKEKKHCATHRFEKIANQNTFKSKIYLTPII